MAYCLPAHTSFKTQPFDVGVFGPFKLHLNNTVHQAMYNLSGVEFDLFELLHLIRQAYENAFIPTTISKAFEKCEIFPVNVKKLLHVCRPRHTNNLDDICNVELLKYTVEAKRERPRRGDCLQSVVLRCGVVQTSNGLPLKRTEALDRMDGKAGRMHRKRGTRKKKKNDIEAFNRIRVQIRNKGAPFEKWAARRRAELYGEEAVIPRPLKVRAAITKQRRLGGCAGVQEPYNSLSHFVPNFRYQCWPIDTIKFFMFLACFNFKCCPISTR